MDLNHLPVYEKYPFDGHIISKANLPVIEIAKFEIEFPNQFFSLESLGYIMVGRNPSGEEIYYSSQAIRGQDGNLYAVHMADISGTFHIRFLKK